MTHFAVLDFARVDLSRAGVRRHVDCLSTDLQSFVRHLLPVNENARLGYLLPAGARTLFGVQP